MSYIMKSSLPTLSLSPLFLQHRDNQCIQLSHILLPDTLSAHIRKHLCKYYTGEKKTKMQCKKNDWGLFSPAFQVKNHVHQIFFSARFRRGQKNQPPLYRLDPSGPVSSDIVRFLQAQRQMSSADIKTAKGLS